MKKERPSVDDHSWDIAEFFLECENEFNHLPEELRCDLKWELAEVVQKAIDGWMEFTYPEAIKRDT